MFCSFDDLKAAVHKKLYEFNHAEFQKREGSRYEAYLDEKEFLHPLPAIPYEIATWVYGRSVNIDYHVVFEHNRYSCPYQYAKKKVDLRITDTKVEIYPYCYTQPLCCRQKKISILHTAGKIQIHIVG